MVEKIILVFKTHVDIGFTDLSARVIDKYAGSMLKEVIATCKATQHMGKLQYVWTVPSWLLKIMTERCGEDLKQELDCLIDRGQIVWHALPFTSHTDFCSAEEYIEGLRFGRELSKAYHKPYPLSAKMTDVPGHGIMLPAILEGAGVKFLHLGCNAFATPPRLPLLFYWQAPGGEQVLTMYNKGGYGSSVLPPRDWDYPVWMALMQTQDNCGPQSAKMMEKLVNGIREKHSEVEIVCGSMDDFYKELMKYDLSKLPVVGKDLGDTWIHGIGAYPREVGMVREAREKSRRLQAIRAKQILEQGTGPSDRTTELLDRYYENICLFEEHTWGADVKTWLGPDRVYCKKDFTEERKKDNYKFMERSWQEQSERAEQSVQDIRRLKIRLEQDGPGTAFLFNPGSSEYTGWVSLEEMDGELSGHGVSLWDKSLPLTKIDGKWHCFVTKLPPFVTVPLRIENAPSHQDKLYLTEEGDYIHAENHRYCLTFSRMTGDITELYDRKLGAALLRQQGRKSVFGYQYDRYGIKDVTAYLRDYAYRFSDWGVKDYGREAYPECRHKTYYPSFKAFRIEQDTVILCYENLESVEKYGDARRVILEITLPPAGEELFVSVRLTGKSETPYIESGSFLLPAAPELKRYRVNKPNVVLDPSADIQENANHALYCLENFISAEDEKHGICVIPQDTPLAALGDTGIYKFRKEYVPPREPVIHFNLFNNMWGTNFPQWLGGDMSFRYILFGYEAIHEDEVPERSAMLKEGIELTGNRLTEECVRFPEHMQLINVRETKDGMIVRMKELSGRPGVGTLRVDGFGIEPVDLMNRTAGKITEGVCDFETRPYGIYSFRLFKTKKE